MIHFIPQFTKFKDESRPLQATLSKKMNKIPPTQIKKSLKT
ncbi:hypothetical protein AALB_1085 [Agarivorans albus MKT 106]|uniref:Uncharacterized protein n=1 Tax=Agarivorans albus MKT 106 TaxID=1331007 RepID=R9PI14_AGAAL|nr:hypothetical protein AALB_1085 [Agarivorans albus MKT 106]